MASFLMTVMVPVGRMVNTFVFSFVILVYFILNRAKFEIIEADSQKMLMECVLIYSILNKYLDGSSRTEFEANHKKIQVSGSFKNVLTQLSEGVIV